MNHVSINAVRSNALFVSTLQPSDDPGAEEVRQAIAQAVRQFHCAGCAAQVAQEFGDHPETAVERMRWSRRKITELFATASPHLAHHALVAA
jgi:hypothetical protein